MEIRLPITKQFEIPYKILEYLEQVGQCTKGNHEGFVTIPSDDIMSKSCRKFNHSINSCEDGLCTSYRIKDFVAAYDLIKSKTRLESVTTDCEATNLKNLTFLTIIQKKKGNQNYVTDKIILMTQCEFSQYLL